VDPNLDPELALALRVSMEEERARQEAAMKRSAEDSTAKGEQAGESSSAPDVAMSDAGPVEITDKSSDMIIVSFSCIMRCPDIFYDLNNGFLYVCILAKLLATLIIWFMESSNLCTCLYRMMILHSWSRLWLCPWPRLRRLQQLQVVGQLPLIFLWQNLVETTKTLHMDISYIL
jgi:hypothetical protein